MDMAPVRASPGPELPVPAPVPAAGTWQKRPVKSGGHRHWFREEHWPPFMQGRGHTTTRKPEPVSVSVLWPFSPMSVIFEPC